jgi:hypothetical protein
MVWAIDKKFPYANKIEMNEILKTYENKENQKYSIIRHIPNRGSLFGVSG